MKTRLCVAITEQTTARAVEAVRALPPDVSTVEVRFDYIAEPDVERICRACDREMIATCRPPRQGGRFYGEEPDRLDILRRAAAAGAAFVDLEEDSRHKIGFLALPAGCRLILSSHDFSRTPDDLPSVFARLHSLAPDGAIVKLATKAESIIDAVCMLRDVREFILETGCDAIGLCMGEEGLITRILAPKVGAFLTFASAGQGGESAPGQLPFREMLDLYHFDRIGPRTRVYGVIANPVGHSMSPAIHNAAFAHVGLDAVYLPLKVHAVEPFVPAFRPFDVGGYSVTIPHKEAMVALVDEVEPLVEEIGALNTVVYDGDRAFGYNTDVNAAVGAIREACVQAGWGEDENVLLGQKVLLIGAGGAGRALAHGLKAAGALLTVANRTVERAERLAAEVDAEFVPLDGVDTVEYDILVNTTSVGMSPKVDAMPVPAEILNAGTVVFDAVYNPLETRLLRCAREAGCIVATGFQWFVGQAAAQFELWTQHAAPLEIMADVVRRKLGH